MWGLQGVELPETSRQSTEQGISYFVAHVCFIAGYLGFQQFTIDQALLITMQEELPSSMIVPLSDGNAQGMDSSTEETVV